MPELPEVETIYRQLLEKFYGRKLATTITGILAPGEGGLYNEGWSMNMEYLKPLKTMVVSVIDHIQRKGKNLAFYGDSGRIRIHLGMSGRLHTHEIQLATIDEILKVYKHVKAIITFNYRDDSNRGFRIIFCDPRGFGACELDRDANPSNNFRKIKQLGIDPTYPREFTIENFRKVMEKSPKQAIGTTLMRQELICGIGNIYRSEILHAASILPVRKCETLKDFEIEELFQCIFQTLIAAINKRGTSMLEGVSTYRDLNGNKGEYAHSLAVYQRDGMVCLTCGTSTIKTLDLEAMRRAYFCENCQK